MTTAIVPACVGYSVSSLIGVRAGGASVSDLQDVRFSAAWEKAQQHVELTRWLQVEGGMLSDLLFPIIGQCVDRELKPVLVALRRAVFQVKAPGGRAWSAQVRQALPAELVTRLAGWLRRLEEATGVRDGLPEVLAAERAAKTAVLRRAVGRDAFRFALLLASPTLAEALRLWLDEPDAATPRDQVLLRAAKYLSRAVAKTSPFSSFTVSGLGRWEAGSAGELSWRGVAELDRNITLRLWDALAAARPEVRDQLRVRINPSAFELDGQLRFLGADLGEPVVGVALGEPLRGVLDWVRTAAWPSLGGLRAHLEGMVSGDERGRCADYLDELVRLGLLELVRPFADQDPDPLATLARWVSPEHREPLDDLRAAVRDYPELTEANARTQRLAHVDAMLGQLLGDATPPAHVLVRESALVTHPAAACPWERWRPVCDDLDALRGVLGIFNVHLPMRARVAEFFLDQFGSAASIGFLRFYQEFHQAGAARSSGGEPRVGKLAGLRRAAVRALYGGGDQADGVVRVDPGVLAMLPRTWPASVDPPGSICCYGQPLPGPDGPQFVLNRVCTGYGWGISRTHQLIGQTGQPFPMPWRTYPTSADPNVVLAECRAGFATNLNLRPAALSYVLDYPGGDPDDDSAAERVSLAELTVDYDLQRTRLVLRDARGREVRPLVLGLLVEHQLPPALYFLVRVFGEPQTALAPERQLAGVGWRSGPDALQQRPRLELGHVVLVRAAWSLPAEQVPVPDKGESDAGYLLRVARWRAEHGIPAQSFVRVVAAAGQAGRPRARAWDKSRKPQYLDLANWFSLIGFARSLAQRDRANAVVVFEEALPALEDAPRYGEHGQRVTEYIIELSGAGT